MPPRTTYFLTKDLQLMRNYLIAAAMTLTLATNLTAQTIVTEFNRAMASSPEELLTWC